MTRGEYMRRAREEAGLTVRQLASLSGVSFTHIAAIERGSRVGSIITVELLADALGLTIDEYTGRDPPPKRPAPQKKKKRRRA